jgi:hypothetical protein
MGRRLLEEAALLGYLYSMIKVLRNSGLLLLLMMMMK